MWKTALFLIFTLIVVPVLGFYYGDAPSKMQWKAIKYAGWVYHISAALCFVVSSLTDNYSQVDKLWSISPIAYAWIIAWVGEFDERLIIMAVLVSIWGVRLTYNFNRRGGYSWKFWTGDEDYRWSVLRARPEFQPSWKWVLFNLFFISFYQMGLILLITFPMVKAIGGDPVYWLDYLIAGIIVLIIIIETIADQQQWNYQKKKYEYINQGKKPEGIYAKGFVHSGLWKIVRHPNYSAEQGVWIFLYFFSVTASGQWINWSITGCLLLILLFRGSSNFSEEITEKKYPEYKNYKKKTGRFLPKIL